MSVTLLGTACVDQLPTEVLQTPTGAPGLNISQGEGPWIATDKQDYGPGETVAIDGWGWTAGETITFQIVHTDDGDNEKASHQPWDVTADEDGNVESSWYVDEVEAGAALKLTADGQTSGGHAELVFTDLNGSVALYTDAPRTISQTAYPWGATVYPRLTGGASNNCYQIQWKDPSDVVQQTNTFGPGSTSYNPAAFAVPATGPSGTWSVVVAQNTAGNCAGPFTSPADPILFDVARAVVIGAGTTADDASGGDQCVAQVNAPSGGCGATSTSIWVRSQFGDNVRSFVQFDLSTSTPSVPAGVQITDAKVRLTSIGTPGSQRTYEIQRADAAWDEGNVTWAGQPGVTGSVNNATILTALTPGTGGGDPQTWFKWTVTADVQGFHAGTFTNNGWRISDAAENNGSPIITRFTSTENVCTPGTTCNRVKPVLLIDYVDPPKLVFTTTAKTGVVGECLGPMRVQSQDFGGSPLAVGADLTINLTTDAAAGLGDIFGTAGEGHFHNDADCLTNTVPPKILSGEHTSQDFWYRAIHRGDGTHKITAAATGYTPDPEQTQTINKTPTTVIYTGDMTVFSGNTFTMKATLTSSWPACVFNGSTTPDGRRVLFRIDPDPTDGIGFLGFPFTFTNSNGVATRTTPTTDWFEGIYDITANAVDNDDCDAGKDNAALAVLMPGNAATGGGFLAGSKVGGGRFNFGFNVRPVEGSDPTTYKGQFLGIKTDGGVPVFRCKGYLDQYGTTDHDSDETTPDLNGASGRCDFQVWDPDLNGGEGGWTVPTGYGYTNRPFTIYFVDNGSGKGKNAPPPDEFGFQISFVGTIADPSFPVYSPPGATDLTVTINGGNIDVKTSGGSNTSTSGTTEPSSPTKGGGRKK